MLPMQSIDHAIAEMRFARRDLGFRGGFIRPNPYNDRKLHDPAYDPLWSAAEDLDSSYAAERPRERARCRRRWRTR